jgi:hypothetical protein
MGSLLFTCSCGEFRFLDSTDDRTYVAHFMAEREWLPFLDAVDAAVEHAGPTAHEREDACMELRGRPARMAWQCPACGALYVEDQRGERHRFLPESPRVPRDLFQPVTAVQDPVQAAHKRLEECRRRGEEAYDWMYEASSPGEATACYSDAKEAFYDAIQAARELRMEDEVKALEARLAHIKDVFRAQFS